MADLALSVLSKVGGDAINVDEELLEWSRALSVLSTAGIDAINSNADFWVFARALQVRGKFGQDKLSLTMSWMRALSAFSKAGLDSSSLQESFSRALSAISVVGADAIVIDSMIADILSPPSADVFIFKDGTEQPLNNNAITRHDSYGINLYVTGERVASETNGSMNVTFTAKISPLVGDLNATIRRTLINGGVRYLGNKEVTTYKGKETRAYYQIRLLPKDTESLNTDTWLYYDIQLDDGLANGERHTVASGKFLVKFDLYRGMGGNQR